MLTSIIAVAGTLLGCLVTGVMQHRVTAAARAEDRAEARHQAVVDAVADVATALAAHRRAMWVREDARLRGAAAEEIATTRAESHATRSAITAPLVRLSVLAPALAVPAREAAQAAFALRGAPDAPTLDARRQDALAAVERVVEAAARSVAGHQSPATG
ncbi:protein kilB [Streptomyces huiliensis]|uniref:protein kilB n=1 Tax=Streptomyces huiliensis TaxID=2876027 RepID=UPI001CC0702F|nr:protein kilB [Streptomyces huiliensis]MBZ4319398.1 protein kilB [Streptomyces huiliensis]